MSKFLIHLFFNCCIPLLFNPLYYIVINADSTEKCATSNNMGTVLFTASDVRKECWSPDEIALLTTRMILEDLLPDVSIIHIDSNAYVDDIMEYFKMVIDVVRRVTHGRKKHITLVALTDLIGGYFQHAIIPIARRAYYAGLIDFTSIEKLIQMLEEIKWFLRTNGQGWAKPLAANKIELEVDNINLKLETPKGNKSCCRRLIYYEHEIIKKNCKEEKPETRIDFPLPFFDSKVLPTAIAVPFYKYPLRNIESRKAAYLIMKFFLSGYQCLLDRHANKYSMMKFQNNLFNWLKKDVIPRLNDDKFYAAFGGVLRIEQTLESLGATMAIEKIEKTTSCDEAEEPPVLVTEKTSNKHSSMILLIMILIIFIWFIIGTGFICYRMKKGGQQLTNNTSKIKKKEKKDQDKQKSKSPESTSSSFSTGKWTSMFSSSSKSKKSSSKGKTVSEKSGDTSSLQSSESEHQEKTTSKIGTVKPIKVCYPPNKPPYMVDDKPAVIEAKQMMKTLSSIAEISENSSRTSIEPHKKRITFDSPLASSKPFVVNPDASYKIKPCPKYSNLKPKTETKKTFLKQILSDEEDVDECLCYKVKGASLPSTKEDTYGDTSDTETTTRLPQSLACHSSLTGDYETAKKASGDQPYAFGYDFHTSSSSEISEDDTDRRTTTS